MIKIWKNNNKIINDKELENVSGGYVFNKANYPNSTPGYIDRQNPYWEVIDDETGKVLYTFRTKEEAQKAARELGLDDMEIEIGHINWLRSVGYLPGQEKKKKK